MKHLVYILQNFFMVANLVAKMQTAKVC